MTSVGLIALSTPVIGPAAAQQPMAEKCWGIPRWASHASSVGMSAIGGDDRCRDVDHVVPKNAARFLGRRVIADQIKSSECNRRTRCRAPPSLLVLSRPDDVEAVPSCRLAGR